MRPARNASRPASTALRMAEAISTGSLAAAMAVFISTPSQPSSMAMAASDAVPTPASTSTGTLALSMISSRLHLFWMPRPEPIGAASGITATQPISSRRLATIGSSEVYTITSKPSATRRSAAIRVSVTCGYSVFGGVAAGGVRQQGELVRRQVLEQVRCAFVLAEVGAAQGHGHDFGAGGEGGLAGLGEIGEFAGAGEQAGTVGPAGDDQRVVRSRNRHGGIIAGNARPRQPSAAAHGLDDFDTVAGLQAVLRMPALRHDAAVHFHRQALLRQAEGIDQRGHAQSVVDLADFAIEIQFHAAHFNAIAPCARIPNAVKLAVLSRQPALYANRRLQQAAAARGAALVIAD